MCPCIYVCGPNPSIVAANPEYLTDWRVRETDREREREREREKLRNWHFLLICVSIHLSIYQPNFSICVSIYLSFYLFIYLSIYQSFCLPFYQSISISIYLSMTNNQRDQTRSYVEVNGDIVDVNPLNDHLQLQQPSK